MSAEDTFINYIDVDTPIVVMENICKRYKIEFKSGYWGFKKYVEDVDSGFLNLNISYCGKGETFIHPRGFVDEKSTIDSEVGSM